MSSLRKGYLHLAFQSMRVSRLRSFMTMLGIVIAVVSVVVIVSIGEGVKQQVGNQAARYGRNVLVVSPVQDGSTIAGNGLPGGTGNMLSPKDVEVVRRVTGVAAVAPLSAIEGQITADYKLNAPLVIATTEELGDILNQKIDYGAFFTTQDGDQTAVIGADMSRKLFSDNAPLGQQFTFRGKTFLVSGVFKPFVAAPFSLEANYNQAVFIPYTAAQDILGYAPPLNQLFIKAKPNANMSEVAQAVEDAITSAHGGARDAQVLAPGERGSATDRTVQLLTYMTLAVALLALVLGGVGIMNMMLLSVAERIHEIGLRKAIGATNRQVLRQFMTEAFAISVVGSIIGVVTALIIVGLLRVYTTLQPVFVWQVTLIAPVVAIAIGVFFGSIPAIKAARMDPIEALRHE